MSSVVLTPQKEAVVTGIYFYAVGYRENICVYVDF